MLEPGSLGLKGAIPPYGFGIPISSGMYALGLASAVETALADSSCTASAWLLRWYLAAPKPSPTPSHLPPAAQKPSHTNATCLLEQKNKRVLETRESVPFHPLPLDIGILGRRLTFLPTPNNHNIKCHWLPYTMAQRHIAQTIEGAPSYGVPAYCSHGDR